MDQESSDCLTENELIAWATGKLSQERIRTLDVHMDTCEFCQALLGEVLRESSDTDQRRPRADTFAENELVAGRYRVVRFIARGGMGEVYEVFDLWLKDTVALKTLVAPIADDPSALARLKAEVLIARRISHPNVCRVFDLGFHNKLPVAPGALGERIAFLTMEFLRGETLKARLARTGRFERELAANVALQMITGMAHAHAAGIIHRDFKSDNVMLVDGARADGLRVVVMDFGLARSSLRMFTQPITSSGHGALGTLDYMAPEQVEGRPATPQSDIYALGLVLFEMMTGRMAFEGDSPVARALRRSQSAPPRPSKIVPELDPSWDAPIVKCLAVDPRERFQRVDEIVPLLQEQPPVASRRTWLVLPLLAAVIAGIVLLVRSSSSDHSSTSSLPSPPSRPAAASSAPTPLGVPDPPTPASVTVESQNPPPSASSVRVVRHAVTPASRRIPGSTSRAADGGTVAKKYPGPAADHLLDPFGH